MDYQNKIQDLAKILGEFFESKGHLLERVVGQTCKSLEDGHKVLIFGNGGSASQAQHFAAELVNKFLKERAPIRAIALSTDTSVLTSIANDTSFDYVFSRQVEALADEGDIVIALSTSGNSPNVIEALKAARDKKLKTVAFTGKGGGRAKAFADYLLDVPSESTPRIQEVHIFLLHLLAQEIEQKLG
jgi:D-sedoheptulose 7-phosphate isomerase